MTKRSGFSSEKLNIVQTWKTRDSVPDLLEECVQTWRELNPDARHHFVDDEELWGWLRKNSRRFPSAIQSDDAPIRTVDMFRYCNLLDFGGLYVDLDFICLRSHTEWLKRFGSHLVLGSMKMPAEWHEHTICNAWIYVRDAGHPLFFVLLDLADVRTDSPYVEFATGSVLLRDALNVYRACRSPKDLLEVGNVANVMERTGYVLPTELPGVTILDPEVLYPLSWGYAASQAVMQEFRSSEHLSDDLLRRSGVTERSYATTFWNHSW